MIEIGEEKDPWEVRGGDPQKTQPVVKEMPSRTLLRIRLSCF